MEEGEEDKKNANKNHAAAAALTAESSQLSSDEPVAMKPTCPADQAQSVSNDGAKEPKRENQTIDELDATGSSDTSNLSSGGGGEGAIRFKKLKLSHRQYRDRSQEDESYLVNTQTGVYILASQKNFSPPPLNFVEILPCFWRFFFGHLGFIKVF